MRSVGHAAVELVCHYPRASHRSHGWRMTSGGATYMDDLKTTTVDHREDVLGLSRCLCFWVITSVVFRMCAEAVWGELESTVNNNFTLPPHQAHVAPLRCTLFFRNRRSHLDLFHWVNTAVRVMINKQRIVCYPAHLWVVDLPKAIDTLEVFQILTHFKNVCDIRHETGRLHTSGLELIRSRRRHVISDKVAKMPTWANRVTNCS